MLEGTDTSARLLLKEAGGHRWQRVPPTERKGRVHTSTVTVAAFEVKSRSDFTLRDSDIETFITKDTGPGGQHRNKTESCVVMRHLPTGIEAKAATKSQHRNRDTAREMLETRVATFYATKQNSQERVERRQMVGSGMRGDKVRTYRTQDDQVTDHRSGKKVSLRRVLRGELGALA